MLKRLVSLAALLWSGGAHGRPEYATFNNVTSCTACHFSETGGGSRNVDGKLYGAHGLEINPFLIQDHVYADVRALYYYPERATAAKGGAGVMTGILGVHGALDAAKRVHLVLEHNLAGFAAAPNRDVYMQLRFEEYPRRSWFEAVQIGRMRVPFGIVTDEHRTYARLLTATTYFDYETGAMLSGNPLEHWHYDLALVNGEKNPGTAPVTGNATRFGGVANLRWTIGSLTLGTSGQYHDHKRARESRSAFTVFGIVSLDRWTQGRVIANVSLEHARAFGWGSQLMSQGFAADPDYVGSLARAAGHASLAVVDWWVGPRFGLIYKYDRLTPDREYPSDFYERHGFGFKWFFAPNANVQVRTEFARATPPSETPVRSTGAQDASFAVLQLAL